MSPSWHSAQTVSVRSPQRRTSKNPASQTVQLAQIRSDVSVGGAVSYCSGLHSVTLEQTVSLNGAHAAAVNASWSGAPVLIAEQLVQPWHCRHIPYGSASPARLLASSHTGHSYLAVVNVNVRNACIYI